MVRRLTPWVRARSEMFSEVGIGVGRVVESVSAIAILSIVQSGIRR
jgi:hypothetical protein